MPAAAPSAPTVAVLLVLLPAPPAGPALPTECATLLADVRRQVGPAVRVLTIDEASHPAVVRSFSAPQLPACVLMRQGVELWRQPGLPHAERLLAALLEALPHLQAAGRA